MSQYGLRLAELDRVRERELAQRVAGERNERRHGHGDADDRGPRRGHLQATDITFTTPGATGSPKTVTVTLTVGPRRRPTSLARGASTSTSATTTADGSGRGNTGSINGPDRSAAGKFGGALSFDGVNDWVTVADANVARPHDRHDDRGLGAPDGGRQRLAHGHAQGAAGEPDLRALCGQRQGQGRERRLYELRHRHQRDHEHPAQRLDPPRRDLRRRHPAALRQRRPGRPQRP